MIIRTNRITFASDTPNSNHNEFKNNTNDFPKLDNFLNAQLYSVSKNFLVVKRNVYAKTTIFFKYWMVGLLKHILNCQVRDSINNWNNKFNLLLTAMIYLHWRHRNHFGMLLGSRAGYLQCYRLLVEEGGNWNRNEEHWATSWLSRLILSDLELTTVIFYTIFWISSRIWVTLVM